jgi:hypothetical protein
MSVKRNVTLPVAKGVTARYGSGMEGNIEVSPNGNAHSADRYWFTQQ